MRIATAALLLIIASTLVACVHETTVFHSFNGADYFRGDPVPPADGSATSQRLAVEPVPSR
jgi:peroxiredoxin family protein